MSFKLENFGSDASNVKSLLGGVNYYRYYNKDNNTLTTPGYFPADLGLTVGDRITVIPSVKTNADELYVVTSIANRTVTVTQIDTYGAVDSVNGKTGHVVLDANDVNAMPQYETMPTASESNAGKIAQFKGETDASYTHGYIYECVATPVYDATVEFNPATLSGTTVTCSGSDFAALVAEYGSGDITTIIKGTLTYDVGGELLVFVGKDDTETTVCTFQLYTQDYVDAGFVFTGTLQNDDVITFSCDIEELTSYASWQRIDVQPTPVSTTTILSSASWSNGSQTVSVSGVTTNNIVFVSPAPTSAADYASAAILCTAQAANSLTFTCESTPSTNISVNIVIM